MSFSNSILARILRRLAQAVFKHPGRFFYPQIILSGLCVLYAVHGLKLDMNRDNLVGPGMKYLKIYQDFRKEFPGEDQLVLMEGDDWGRNRQFVERLAARVEPETNLFTRVFYKGDLTTLGSKTLLLAPTADLEQMHKSVDEYLPFLHRFSQTTNLDSLFSMVNEQFRTGGRGTGGHGEDTLKALPFLDNILVEANQSISEPGPPIAPEIERLFGGGKRSREGPYVTLDKGRIFVLTFQPRNEELVPQAIERMRQLIKETENEVPGVNAGLTGELVLNYDQMRQSKRDTIVAGVAALVICSFIFVIAYQEVRRPLKAAVCLIIGFGYTLGFATLAIGHLNILSISFAPMIIGLALDFGVQFITRYEEEMRNGHAVAESISKATVFTGQGIVISGLTMAAAFLAMGLTHFKGVQEVGIICGGGLLLCMIAMMTALPAWLVMGGGHDLRHQGSHLTRQTRLRIEKIWLQHSAVVVALTVLLCTAAAWQIRNVTFDYDLLHLQSKNLASVRFENKLFQSGGRTVMFASVIADSPQQARQYEEKIKLLPSVSDVTSAARYLTGGQERQLEEVRAIKGDLAGIHFAPMDRQPVQPEKLSITLWYLQGYLGMSALAVQKQKPDLAAQLLLFQNHIYEFRKTIMSGDPQIPKQLLRYQETLFKDIHDTIETLKTQDASRPLRAADLPTVLRERFIGVTGKYLLQVYPRKDIWQHDNQREFLQQLEMVVPLDKVTGPPTSMYQYTMLLKNSYQQAAWYSLGAITIMLFIHFRSPGYVLLALLPVGVGFIWLLGFMGATGISFNPANIMTLPLVVGIGVTNGIQILNRVAEELQPGVLAKSTGKAVLVSGLTAITGFGTLLLSKHEGLKSLGEIMPVGIAMCMIAGLTCLPALLILLNRLGWALGAAKPEAEVEAGWHWHWLQWHKH